MNNFKKLRSSEYYIVFAVLQLYIFGSIFYVFASGLPQPGDLLLCIGIAIGALAYFGSNKTTVTPLFIIGASFAACTFVINMVNYIFISDKTFLFSSLYYIFNFFVFLFLKYLSEKEPEEFSQKIYVALLAAVFVELVFVYFISYKGLGSRAIGTFNNPNQLSYWTLLSVGILVALRYPYTFKTLDYFLLAALFIMSLATLSKAGIIGIAFIVLCLVFTRLIGIIAKSVILVALVMGSIYALSDITNFFSQAVQIEKVATVVDRFVSVQGDESLEQRGYLRVFEQPQYLILGAGEGGYERFSWPYEFHSGVGTLIFSYGITGTLLFCAFIFLIFRNLPPIFWCTLFAMILYGLTHQNIRFTYFWVYLAICYWASITIPYKLEKLSNNRTQKLGMLRRDIPPEPAYQSNNVDAL